MSKQFNQVVNFATGGAILGAGDLNQVRANNQPEKQNNKSTKKRDNRAHVYHFIKKLVKNGIEYIQFETKDGIGMCPVENIDSIKAQFDESLTLATN